jgi:hypothetical protein
MREDFKGLSAHTPLASIAAADHAVSGCNLLHLHILLNRVGYMYRMRRTTIRYPYGMDD